MAINEKVPFRLFHTPCCGHLLCWVNPRPPAYCPECGKFILAAIKSGEHTRMQCDGWLRLENDDVQVAETDVRSRRGAGEVGT